MKYRLVLVAGVLSGMLALSLSGQTKSSEEAENAKCKWGRKDSPPIFGTVKITPLGSHAGEFCRNDRALLFEDPTGIRILWDPGRTVDETDMRLGRIDLVLLSSAHADHLGDAKPNFASPGTCASPATISAAPHPTTATIAAAKNAAVFVGGEMGDYLSRQIQNLRGAPTPSCPASGLNNEMTVPLINAPCVGTLRPGGSRTVRLANASSGVAIANIQTFHSNGIPSAFVDAPTYGGNDGGAVVRFSNDLVVYLTADTGLFGDMETIVRDYYGAELVVVNLGDPNCLGSDEAAYAINQFLRPATVIPSHINEAATSGGNPNGARLRRFIPQVNRRTAVELPLSGVSMEFDGRGRRVK